MNCYISKQIADYVNADTEASMLVDQIESGSNQVLEHGYCKAGYDEIDLAYIIDDAVKDGNDQLLEEISRLIISSTNSKTYAIKELLRPYAEIAVQKALEENGS